MIHTQSAKFKLSMVVLIFALALWFGSVGTGWAAWARPVSSPTACVNGDQGCDPPINISNAAQTKQGSLGISNVLAVFNAAYAKQLATGSGFFDGSATLDPNVALHVDGNLRLKFGSPQAGDVLVAAETDGTLGWEDINDEMLWTRATADTNDIDIYNTAGGAVGVRTGNIALNDGLTVRGALVRYDATASTLTGNIETHVNLGNNSTTGNSTSGLYPTVGGGDNNTASGDYSTVGGGQSNFATGNYSFIGGGSNSAHGDYDTVVGGVASGAVLPTVSGSVGGYNFLGGGDNLDAFGQYNVILGGLDNKIGQDVNNRADFSVVGGGSGTNTVYSDYGSILGGSNNVLSASADYSVVGGGFSNQTESPHSIIPGGENNGIGLASPYSFVGGKDANIVDNAPGAFVWGGAGGATVATSNSFVIHPNAGPTEGYVGIGTAAPTAKLDVNGNVRIRGSTAKPPAAGYVLTAASDNGDAYWESPTAPVGAKPGEGIITVRNYCSGTPLIGGCDVAYQIPSCPSGWMASAVMYEKYGSQYNRVVTCHTDANVQVMTLVGLNNGSNPAPSCPSADWTAWPSSGVWTPASGSGAVPTGLNQARHCYKLNT